MYGGSYNQQYPPAYGGSNSFGGGMNAAQFAQSSMYGGGQPTQTSFVPSYANGGSQVSAADLASSSNPYGGTPVNAANLASGSLDTRQSASFGYTQNPYSNSFNAPQTNSFNPYTASAGSFGSPSNMTFTAAQYGSTAFVGFNFIFFFFFFLFISFLFKFCSAKPIRTTNSSSIGTSKTTTVVCCCR